MIVKRYELADAPAELIDRLAGDYIFSTTSFARMWRAHGGKPVYWIAEENGTPKAIMPGVEFGRGIFRRLQSMPNGCYGRILTNNDNDLKTAEVSMLILMRIIQFGYMKFYLHDFHKSFGVISGIKSKECTTQLVDISNPGWEPPDGKLRQQIHKAERENLSIKKFEADRDMEGFLKLVGFHEKRRSVKSLYGRTFFEALAELARQDNRIKWMWCEIDKAAVSSHIFLREGNSIIHWQMYYDESRSQLQATKLIPYKVAKEAQDEGIKYLNLGASPPEAEGAEFYKSKWGGEIYKYSCYEHKNGLGKFL
jgi:hypothetical protein